MPARNLIIVGILFLGAVFLGSFNLLKDKSSDNTAAVAETMAPSPSPIRAPAAPPISAIPASKILETNYHIFQTFNNCAPAALSMALSYFGVNVSQQSLAADLRPYNNPKGLNDDKSTPPEELGVEAEKYGLIAYFRPNGDINTLKKFIAFGVPVVIRTLLDTSEHEYAHYRVIKGYDDVLGEIIQDDSYQNKNLHYKYADFLAIWKHFNYGYLVLAKPADKAAIEKILGDEVDEKVAWQHALDRANMELTANPNDTEALFNSSVAYYFLGKNEGSVAAFEKSAAAFEKVESGLGKLTLWYQLQPIEAYFNLGKYDRVFSLTNKIFNDGNNAYSELYVLRGKSDKALGKNDLAKLEFEKAVLYNKNSKEARDALASVGVH